MSKNLIQAVRGMKDTLPEEMASWQFVETVLRKVAANYGYREIRTPLLEKTELFKRSIGEVTDIVEKEMYTFEDRNGESLTLRPEATASCVRAGIEHGLFYNQIQRLWYLGPMFRHERPQKGRYRQFMQFGVEVFGMADAEIDAEIILLSARCWRELGIADQLQLQLNSLGSLQARLYYRQQLIKFLTTQADKLDEDSKRRLSTNPLRILDSKHPQVQALLSHAPSLQDYLDEDSRTHFQRLCELLDQAGIKYQINPYLVRGLDYYNKTVFEWVMQQAGAQNTICAGGRYDSLVEQLGGQSTPAVGFALGLERLVSLLPATMLISQGQTADVYLIMAGATARRIGLVYAEHWRDAMVDLRLQVDGLGGSFKSQFKRADKSGAKIALILGEDEVEKRQVTLKYLREDKPQITLPVEQVGQYLQKLIS